METTMGSPPNESPSARAFASQPALLCCVASGSYWAKRSWFPWMTRDGLDGSAPDGCGWGVDANFKEHTGRMDYLPILGCGYYHFAGS